MVLATIVGLSISLVPCLMFGAIIVISFLLCDCEYIGETVAKHFCAWKNRRRDRIKSHSKDVTDKKKLKHGSNSQKQLSTTKAIQRNTLNSSPVHFETHIVEPATAPVLDGSTSHTQNDECQVLESDPPPSYEQCVKSQTPEPHSFV